MQRNLKCKYVSAFFSAVLELGIPLFKPYVIGYLGDKFGEPGSLPAKGEFASSGTSFFHE